MICLFLTKAQILHKPLALDNKSLLYPHYCSETDCYCQTCLASLAHQAFLASLAC